MFIDACTLLSAALQSTAQMINDLLFVSFSTDIIVARLERLFQGYCKDTFELDISEVLYASVYLSSPR